MTAYGQEEAQYHLALVLLDRDGTRARRQAVNLLTLANVDGDYPAAADLLEQLSAKEPLRICRCRRWLSRRIGGKTPCPWHRRPSVRRIRKA